MADLNLINPYWREGDNSGMGGLVHFAVRFPSHAMLNNVRMDCCLSQEPYQLLRRQDFPIERLAKSNLFSVCVDLDEFLVRQKITIEQIDKAMEAFLSPERKVTGLPENYLPFFKLAKPVYIHLIDEKKHEPYFLIN